MLKKSVKAFSCLTLLMFVLIAGLNAGFNQEAQIISDSVKHKAIHSVDIDGDGVNELIAGNAVSYEIEIWKYLSTSNSWILTDTFIGLNSDPHDIASGDFNKDGHVDFVVAYKSAGTQYFINQGNDTDWTATHLDSNYGWQVEVADFDNDGNEDVFISTEGNYLKICYGNGVGGFSRGGIPACPKTNGRGIGFNPVDFDGDGLIDLVGASGEWDLPGTDTFHFRVHKNLGNRQWQLYYTDSETFSMSRSNRDAAADINNDGVIDFVNVFQSTVDAHYKLYVFWGQNLGGVYVWNKSILDTSSNYFGSVTLSDANNDGYLDIILAGDQAFQGIKVFYNDLSGGFNPNTDTLIPQIPAVYMMEAKSDYNNDGINDIAFNGWDMTPFGVLLSNTNPVSNSSWPKFRMDTQNTGHTDCPIPDSLQQQWSIQTNNRSQSAPIISDGKVYVVDEAATVYCINESNGAIEWTYGLGGGNFKSSPVIFEGRLYVGTQNNRLYCLDTIDGSLLWSCGLSGQIVSSPLIAEGRLYVGAGYKVYCIDAFSGNILWNTYTGNMIQSSPAFYNNKIYIGLWNNYYGSVACFDKDNGYKFWEVYTQWPVTGSPCIYDGKLYAANSKGMVYCIDTDSGFIWWQYQTSQDLSGASAAAANNMIYINNDGMLYAFDHLTGDVIWQLYYPDGLYPSPIAADGKILISTYDNQILVINALNGLILDTVDTGGQIRAEMAVANNRIYANNFTTLQTVAFGEYHNNPPVAQANGPYTIPSDQGFSFSATGSNDPDDGDSIILYEWDLDNDGAFEHTSTQEFCYVAAEDLALLPVDSYETITLRVTDTFGASSIDTTHLTVYNNVPSAYIYYTPSTPYTGDEVTFNGFYSSHSSPFNEIVSYEWDFSYALSEGFNPEATGDTVTYTFNQAIMHIVALRVTDNNIPPKTDMDTDNIFVYSANQPPVITGYLNTANVTTGESVTLWATATDDGTVTGMNINVAGFGSYTMSYSAQNSRWEYVFTAPTDFTGTIFYTYTAYDNNGAASGTSACTLNVQDNVMPEITAVSGNLSGTTGEQVLIWAVIQDNVGIDRAIVTDYTGVGFDMTYNADQQRWEYSYTVPDETTQVITYQITAIDLGGLNAYSSIYQIQAIDNDPPVLVDIAGSLSTGTGDMVVIWAKFSDNISIYNNSLDIKLNLSGIPNLMTMSWNPALERYEYPFTAPFYDDSDRTYTITANDISGNSMVTDTYNVTVFDNKSPWVHLDCGPITAGPGETAAIWVEVYDNIALSAASISMDGTPPSSMTWNASENRFTYDYVVPDAITTHQYSIRVFDTSNNEVSYANTVEVIDNVPPTITADCGHQSVTTGESVTIWTKATDNVGVTRAVVDSGATGEAGMTYNSGNGRWEYIFTCPSNWTGSFSFEIKVLDEAGNSANNTYEMMMNDNDTPEIISQTVPSFAATGSTITFIAAAQDNVGIESVWLFYRDFGAGSYSGTAMNHVSGDTYEYSMYIPTGYGSDIQYFFKAYDYTPLTAQSAEQIVDINSPPVIDPIAPLTFNEGEEAIFSVIANDPDTADTLSYVGNNMPIGAWMADINFIWPTSFTDAGIYDVDIYVSDGHGGEDMITVNLTILNVNQPPAIGYSEPAPNFTINEGDIRNFYISASDIDNDPLSYSWKFDGADVGTNFIQWEYHSTYQDAGLHIITCDVSDGTNVVTQTWNLTVNNINNAPVIDAGPDILANGGDEINITVTATDTNNDPLTLSADSLPAGAAFTDNGNGTGLFNWPTSDSSAGAYTITFTADDGELSAADNIEIAIIDVTPPVIEIWGVTDGAHYNTDVAPEVAISEANPGSYNVNVTKDGAPYAFVEHYPVTEEGVYVLTVDAYDQFGNTCNAQVTFTIDKTVPGIAIGGVWNGAHFNYDVEPYTEVTDDNLKTSEILLNGVPYNNEVISAEGDYTLSLYGEDYAGNTWGLSMSFTVDKTVPGISVAGVSDGVHYNYDVEPYTEVSDANLKTSEILLNGVPYNNETISADGDYTLSLYGEDYAGNTWSLSLSFTVDKTVPGISTAGIWDGAYFNYDVEPYTEVTDDNLKTSEILLNGVPYNNETISAEGDYTLSLYGEDYAGNSWSLTYNFTIDKTVPVISVTGITDGGLYDASVTPVINVTETNPKTQQITLDGADFVSGSIVNAEGAHTLYVYVKDKAGNEASQTVSFTVDFNYAPAAQNGSADVDEDSIVDITLTADDADNDVLTYQLVDLPLNGTAVLNGNIVTYTPNPDYFGADSFTFKANDGEYDSNTAEVAITVNDKTPPVIEIWGVTDGAHYNTDVGPEAAISEANPNSYNVNVTKDGAPYAFIEHYPVTEEGVYVLTVDADDQFGNTSSAQVTFTIDKTVPGISVGGISDGVHYNYDIEPFTEIYDVNLKISEKLLNGVPYNDETISAEGDYTLSLYGEDYAGNSWSLSLSFTVDKTVPGISVGGISDGMHYNYDVEPYTEVSDANLKTSEILLNGVPYNNEVISAEGDYTLSLYGEDYAGNTWSLSLSFTIDKTVPGISVGGISDGMHYNYDVEPYTEVNDANLKTSEMLLNGVPYNNEAISADGVYNLHLYGEDYAGNSWELNLTFTIDKVSPVISISGVTDSGLYDAPVTPVIDVAEINPQTQQVTLNGADFLSGTMVDAEQAHILYVYAKDKAGNETSVTVTFTLDFNKAPVAEDGSAVLDEDTTADITLIASDEDGDALTYQLVTLPLNGTAVLAGSIVTYTPNLNYFGADSFTFKANDGKEDGNTAAVALTVNPVPDPNPPAALDGSASTDEDTSVDITLSASDADGDALTYVLDTAPKNGTVTISGNTAVYVPDADFAGTDSFRFIANDGALDSNWATVTVTVNQVNDAPSAEDMADTTAEDNSISIKLSATDPEGDALTYVLVGMPANGTAVISGSTVDYTPNPDYFGADSFTYLVNDGALDSGTAAVTITVTSENDDPVSEDGSAVTDEDVSIDIVLIAADADSDPLTYTITTFPKSGTVTIAGNTVTYVPAQDFEGTETFKFVANDGATDSNTAIVTVTVNGVNDAPTADDVSAAVAEDRSKNIKLSAADPEGDTLTYILVDMPSNGTAVLSGNTVTYTPNPDYSGADSFTYIVNDGLSDSNTAAAAITVTPDNDKPVAYDAAENTVQDTSIDIVMQATDADGDVLTYTVVSQPKKGTLTVSGNIATYTPNAGYTGADSFRFLVNDGTSNSNRAIVSITVQ